MGLPGSPEASTLVRRRILPYEDLNTEGGFPTQYRLLTGPLGTVIAVLSAQGPNVPRLLQADDAGNLLVNLAAAIVASQNVAQWGAAAVGAAAAIGDASSAATVAPKVWSVLAGYNNATVDRIRTAAQAIEALKQSKGALLSASPGEWSVPSTPVVGAAASASIVAGGAGVSHVATAVDFGFSATTTLAAIVTVTINLRDGASGVGTVLRSWQFTLPAAVIAAVIFTPSIKNIVGSANTAMTLEFAAGVANLLTFCNLSGYDAN